MSTDLNETVPLCLPLPVPKLSYKLQPLTGLGKATKRGIKKCFKCGVYNGNRSLKCKNKQCRVIFKDSEEKSKDDLNAVRLHTGTLRQVYSVRVRDIGPDYRGFVQLSHSEDDNILTQMALCFVDSCQSLFDDSILKCHEEEPNDANPVCIHINAAVKSCTLATPIAFKNEILQALRVSNEIKEKLFLLATEKEGPLVQRVSKTVMAVKCQVTPKHPLGYLHFTFGCSKGRDIFEKYTCSCTEFIISGSVLDKSSNIRYKCIHYYACICALASDMNFSEEFVHFIGYELPTNTNLFAKIDNNTNVSPPNELDEPIVLKADKEIRNHQTLKRKKVKNKQAPITNVSNINSIKKVKRIVPKIFPIEIKVLSCPVEDSVELSWKFIDWLSYVTESINKSMEFDNCGILNTLIFHIPEPFYIALKTRIPSIYHGKNTSNHLSCSHNVYYIINILHLKEIFDTPKVKLCIGKKFVHTEKNGYVEYDENDDEDSYKSSFIFFLNVGQSTVDESDNTNNSFFIEWLPNISNVTKIGQLKLEYKFGRKST